MWNELTTIIDAWRQDVPWQAPTFVIIIVLSFGVLAIDSWLATRRAKRIARILDGDYATRYRKIERQSHE